MDSVRRRALTAGFSGGIGEARRALDEIGYSLAGHAADGISALGMIEALEPELVLFDAVMPGMDGVALAERVRRLNLNLQPVLLLLRPFGLRLCAEEGLSALGVRILEAPVTAERIREAAQSALPGLPNQKKARLEQLLNDLGVPEHPGQDVLARAVALVWADRRRIHALRASVYPAAGRDAGLSPAQAERAVRHVIDVAWRTGEIDQQQKIFGDTIDARRGKPTCGEMIAQLADILRWEG